MQIMKHLFFPEGSWTRCALREIDIPRNMVVVAETTIAMNLDRPCIAPMREDKISYCNIYFLGNILNFNIFENKFI